MHFRKSISVLTSAALMLSTIFVQSSTESFYGYQKSELSNLESLNTYFAAEKASKSIYEVQKNIGEKEKNNQEKTIVENAAEIIKDSTIFEKGNTKISRGNITRQNPSSDEQERQENKTEVQLMPWFDKVNKLFKIGSTATVTDIKTGLKFQVKRTYGYNHADVETLTVNDTQTLKSIAEGSWNWTRRAVIVEINGVRIAASVTAMPHAGLDSAPMNKVIGGRSGGYGRGVNLDTVKGNEMDGHFDIHFYGSKTHASSKVDKAHQDAVRNAFNNGNK